MIRASRRHLRDVNESYGEHLAAALGIAALMGRAGMACAVHAIIPGLCTRTASRCLARIQARFDRRDLAAPDERRGASAGDRAKGGLPAPPAPVLSR